MRCPAQSSSSPSAPEWLRKSRGRADENLTRGGERQRGAGLDIAAPRGTICSPGANTASVALETPEAGSSGTRAGAVRASVALESAKRCQGALSRSGESESGRGLGRGRVQRDDPGHRHQQGRRAYRLARPQRYVSGQDERGQTGCSPSQSTTLVGGKRQGPVESAAAVPSTTRVGAVSASVALDCAVAVSVSFAGAVRKSVAEESAEAVSKNYPGRCPERRALRSTGAVAAASVTRSWGGQG